MIVDSRPLEQGFEACAAKNLNFYRGLLFFGDLGTN
jgi:hypothetical protein